MCVGVWVCGCLVACSVDFKARQQDASSCLLHAPSPCHLHTRVGRLTKRSPPAGSKNRTGPLSRSVLSASLFNPASKCLQARSSRLLLYTVYTDPSNQYLQKGRRAREQIRSAFESAHLIRRHQVLQLPLSLVVALWVERSTARCWVEQWFAGPWWWW